MAGREIWKKIRVGLVIAAAVLLTVPVIVMPFWRYFTNQEPPVVTIVGADTIPCVSGNASLTVDSVSICSLSAFNVSIDGKLIDMGKNHFVGSKRSRFPITFDSSLLTDGRHVIEIEAVDGGWNRAVTRNRSLFEVDNTDLHVNFDEKPISIKQGQTAHLKFETNKSVASASVSVLGNRYTCGSHSFQPTLYECFIPFDCDLEPGDYPLEIVFVDRAGRTVQLTSQVTLTANTFPRQHGFLIDQIKIDNEHDSSTQDSVLEETISSFYKKLTQEKLWRGAFDVPTVVNRVSTPFGEVRTTPVKGRYLHRAIDIISDPKKVVWASQTGRVIAKDRYHLMGNTVVLDHGLGIITIYSHLDTFADIKQGDILAKGRPLGTVGKTGYASGYHLHWELRINNIPVDPMQFIAS